MGSKRKRGKRKPMAQGENPTPPGTADSGSRHLTTGMPWRTHGSPLNGRLAEIVTVVYGGVLSYGCYVLVKISDNAFGRFLAFLDGREGSSGELLAQSLSAGMLLIAIYFLLCDYAGMVKVNALFPYRRTSRFFIDTTIALLYLLIFTACETRSFLYAFEFAFLLFLAGTWGNNLHRDAALQMQAPAPGTDADVLEDYTERAADRWGALLRGTHYIGSATLIITGVAMLSPQVRDKHFRLDMCWHQVLIIVGVLLLWRAWFVVHAIASSRTARHMLIPGLLPAFCLRRLERFVL